jgi:hypothetical protein
VFGEFERRCRCEPSWRGRRHNAATGKPERHKPVTKDRNEVLSWLGANDKAAAFVREQASKARRFEEIGRCHSHARTTRPIASTTICRAL